MIVDAQDDGRIELVLGRSAQNHPIGTCVEVLVQFRAVGEKARRLERDLASQVLPGKIGGVSLCEDGDRLAVDHQGLFVGLDCALKFSMDAVVLEQHRKVLGVCKIIDGHHLVIRGVLSQNAKHETTDPTKAVDPNTNCHDWTPGSLGAYTRNVVPDPSMLD